MKKKPTFHNHLSKALRDPEFKEQFDAWDLPARIANELCRRRVATGMTQAELASQLNIPQQDISKVETLSGGIPKLATLQKIASALGMELGFSLRQVELNIETPMILFIDQSIPVTRNVGVLEDWIVPKQHNRIEAKERSRELVLC
jgi:transcriptional regulator with XRE-family HTH domain